MNTARLKKVRRYQFRYGRNSYGHRVDTRFPRDDDILADNRPAIDQHHVSVLAMGTAAAALGVTLAH